MIKTFLETYDLTQIIVAEDLFFSGDHTTHLTEPIIKLLLSETYKILQKMPLKYEQIPRKYLAQPL